MIAGGGDGHHFNQYCLCGQYKPLHFCCQPNFHSLEMQHLNFCCHNIRSDLICALQNMELIKVISRDPFHGSSLTLDGLYSQTHFHHHRHHRANAAFNDDEAVQLGFNDGQTFIAMVAMHRWSLQCGVCQYYTKKTRWTLGMLQITILNDMDIVKIKGGTKCTHLVAFRQVSVSRWATWGADLLLTPS